MKIGTIVKMSRRFKGYLQTNGSYEHIKEFGNCFGIVVNILYNDVVDVRWQPSNLRYMYSFYRDLQVVYKIDKQWFTYIVKCSDESLYTGITNNLPLRIHKHNEGLGAKYTKGRGPVTLIRFYPCNSKSEALKLEYKIKQLPKDKKV